MGPAFASNVKRFLSLATVLGLSACGEHAQQVSLLPAAGNATPSSSAVVRAASAHVAITEYSLAGVTTGVSGVGAVAPDGSLWLGAGLSILHVTAAGSPATITLSNPTCGLNCTIATGSATYRSDNTIWFDVQNFAGTVSGSGVIFTNASGVQEGSDSVSVAAFSSGPVGNVVVGSDGRVWFLSCGVFSGGNSCLLIAAASGSVQPYSLGSDLPNSIAAGPDGKLYLTEVTAGGDSSVAQIDTQGTVLRRFLLPPGSISSSGTASGITSDGRYLWIVESGVNKIGRMTTGGALTQYSIPTASAGVRNIALGSDKRLWFTEFAANKIGRIDRTGKIAEFVVPTARSGPDGISSLDGTQFGGKRLRYVWVVEDNADALAKVNI